MAAECKSLSDLRELNESELFLRVNFASSVSLSMKKSIIFTSTLQNLSIADL